MLDLNKFEFPTKNVFSQPTNKELLQAAKDKGFYKGHTPYNELFNTLFFRGGQVVFKPEVSDELRNKAWNYLKSFIKSFEPKHEEKEAICAYLLSEIVYPELAKD